jgi:hypothetical protein
MKAREILLAILIIAAGILFYYAKTGKIDLKFDEFGRRGFFFSNYDEFTFDESRDIAAPLPSEVQVINARGSVEIHGAETDKITISLKKRIWRRTKEDAQKIADRLKMAVNREDPRLIISTNRDDFKKKPFETEFKITVPAGMNVLVKNSYGPAKTAKTGKTDITNPHGQVSAADVSGELIIQNSYENVDVSNVQAGCRITSPHSDVTVINIQGDLAVDHQYGTIHLEHAGRKVKIDGRHTEVFGQDLKSDVEITSSYETVKLSDVGPTKIRNHHGDVEAAGVKGTLEISNEYGRIHAENVQGNFKVEGKDVAVQAKSILAEDIWISSSYQNVELIGFTGKTTVLLTHGDLRLEPESLTGPVDVQASYANIHLVWPVGGKFPFEGQAKSGTIKWQLSEKPALEETNGLSVTKAFLDEKNKPSIKLSTSYGDIRVEENTRTTRTT